jgi:hypothetical protein
MLVEVLDHSLELLELEVVELLVLMEPPIQAAAVEDRGVLMVMDLMVAVAL